MGARHGVPAASRTRPGDPPRNDGAGGAPSSNEDRVVIVTCCGIPMIVMGAAEQLRRELYSGDIPSETLELNGLPAEGSQSDLSRRSVGSGYSSSSSDEEGGRQIVVRAIVHREWSDQECHSNASDGSFFNVEDLMTEGDSPTQATGSDVGESGSLSNASPPKNAPPPPNWVDGILHGIQSSVREHIQSEKLPPTARESDTSESSDTVEDTLDDEKVLAEIVQTIRNYTGRKDVCEFLYNERMACSRQKSNSTPNYPPGKAGKQVCRQLNFDEYQMLGMAIAEPSIEMPLVTAVVDVLAKKKWGSIAWFLYHHQEVHALLYKHMDKLIQGRYDKPNIVYDKVLRVLSLWTRLLPEILRDINNKTSWI